jgi:hypothetical protein
MQLIPTTKKDRTTMTPEELAGAFLKAYPDATKLNRAELERLLSQYVTTSYVKAHASINLAKSFNKPADSTDVRTAELLQPYLGDISPVADVIKPQDQAANDPSQMNRAEYEAWRRTQPWANNSAGLFG